MQSSEPRPQRFWLHRSAFLTRSCCCWPTNPTLSGIGIIVNHKTALSLSAMDILQPRGTDAMHFILAHTTSTTWNHVTLIWLQFLFHLAAEFTFNVVLSIDKIGRQKLMLRKTDIPKKCWGLADWSYCWTGALLRSQSMFLSQRRRVPHPQGGRWSWWREMCSHLLFLHRVRAERKIRVLQKYSSGSSWFFFFCSYETWKSNTTAIKIRGYIALGVLSVSPYIFECSAFPQSLGFCSLLCIPPFFSFDTRGSFSSQLPGFGEFLNLGLPGDKMQAKWSCRAPGNHGFFIFVVSCPVFLIAYHEEIPLLQSESLTTLFFQSRLIILSIAYSNSWHFTSALSQAGRHCAEGFQTCHHLILATR